MVKTYKVMHFFKLKLYRIKGTEQDFFNKVEFATTVQKLIKDKLTNNTIKVLKEPQNPESESAVIEVVKVTDKYIFGKIGTEKDIKAFQLRDNSTMKSSPLTKGKNETFEAFSYFYIDLKSHFVGYLQEMSAPSIKYLGDVFTNEFNNTFGQLNNLYIEDALPILANCAVIGSIEYNMELPINNMPVELTHLPEHEIKKLQNQKRVTMSVKHIAERRTVSAFKDVEDLTTFLQYLKNHIKGLKTVKVNAKENEDSITQTYTLNNSPLTKKVDFDYTNTAGLNVKIEEIIETRMDEEFDNSRKSLRDYER